MPSRMDPKKRAKRVVWHVLHNALLRFEKSGTINWSALHRKLNHDRVTLQGDWEAYMDRKGLFEIPRVDPRPDPGENMYENEEINEVTEDNDDLSVNDEAIEHFDEGSGCDEAIEQFDEGSVRDDGDAIDDGVQPPPSPSSPPPTSPQRPETSPAPAAPQVTDVPLGDEFAEERAMDFSLALRKMRQLMEELNQRHATVSMELVKNMEKLENMAKSENLLCLRHWLQPHKITLTEARATINGRLDKVKVRAWLVFFELSDEEIAKKLVELQNKGVDVNVLVDSSLGMLKAGSAANYILRKHKVPFHVLSSDVHGRLLHCKAMILDNMLVTGSASMSKQALGRNIEDMFWFTGGFVETYAHDFCLRWNMISEEFEKRFCLIALSGNRNRGKYSVIEKPTARDVFAS